MTSVFDGMAGVLNGVFGASVTIYPGGGPGKAVRGVLRRQQVDLETDEGFEVISAAPVLRINKGDAAGLGPGDRVEAGGQAYTVRFPIPITSPASDAFQPFALWEVSA